MYQANNYGYNPYGTYMPPRPMQQPIQQPTQPIEQPVNNAYKLQGKLVDSIETARSSEYTLDGSTSYFALTDGSAIVTKQLQNDGTSKITVFKPLEEENNTIKYITQEDMEKALNGLEIPDIDDLKDDLEDLKKELRDLKKKKA